MKHLCAAVVLVAASAGAAAAGPVIQDCPECPRMVEIAPGSFMMGDAGIGSQIPVHRVTVANRFALGETEVTLAQFRYFISRTGYTGGFDDDSRADPKLPAAGVDWRAAHAYVRWLARHTGQRYRLPTEVEWEYAAGAGTVTRYWWGDQKADACGKEHVPAEFFGLDEYACKHAGAFKVRPVGSLAPNPWGLYDMLGNAEEWIGSCYAIPGGNVAAAKVYDCFPGNDHRTVRKPGDRFVAIGRDSMSWVKKSPLTGFRVVKELP